MDSCAYQDELLFPHRVVSFAVTPLEESHEENPGFCGQEARRSMYTGRNFFLGSTMVSGTSAGNRVVVVFRVYRFWRLPRSGTGMAALRSPGQLRAVTMW